MLSLCALSLSISFHQHTLSLDENKVTLWDKTISGMYATLSQANWTPY